MSTIQPADVYSRIQLVLGELDLIRQEMGRPRDQRPAHHIAGAAPREVYFEATALFRKADRFCFERTGHEGTPPYPPAATAIAPADCLAMVDAALERLREVKGQLRVEESAKQPAVEPARQPTDCLHAVLLANRQLNRLLEQPFSPSDVYQILTLAQGYAARLAAHVGAAIPAVPAFERKKRPGDVYLQVHATLGTLREIVGKSGATMLDPGAAPYPPDDVLPSDCYDVTSLLLSELVFLHARVPNLPPPGAAEMYEVGHKLPSHCFQRAAHVDATLRAVAAHADRLR